MSEIKGSSVIATPGGICRFQYLAPFRSQVKSIYQRTVQNKLKTIKQYNHGDEAQWLASYQESKYAHRSWFPTYLRKKITNTKFAKRKNVTNNLEIEVRRTHR